MHHLLPIVSVLVAFTVASPPVLRADAGDEKLAFFEAKIRPVLVKHCYECHAASSKEVKGGLLVDSRAGLLRGGDSGPAIIVGKPDASPLIEALRYEGVEMPPDGRLPAAVVRDFEVWVKAGATDPRKETERLNGQRTIDIDKGKEFWSFKPIVAHRAPDVRDASWPRSEIDAFIWRMLQAEKLKPVDDADRATLVRRLYFDLLGLPPTPAQMREVLEDESPRAIESLVDRLLASRHFGEHWGRHWLDVARYADSNGGDFNATFHNAWRYRDYVIAAMNDDKPFDQFIREQIAGDLLPYDSDEQRAQQLIATGFLMLGTKMLSERDKEKLKMDVADEQINTVGSAFLGLTLGCARCHDHKFDPIPTRDYYALAGVFTSTRTLEGESQKYVSTWTKTKLPVDPAMEAKVKAHAASKKKLEKELKRAEESLAKTKQLIAAHVRSSGLFMDDADAKKVGTWIKSTHSKPFVGAGYIHDDKAGKGEKSVEFTFKVPNTATYDVRIAYTASSGRDAGVPVTIQSPAVSREVKLDQTKRPAIDKLFASVGMIECQKNDEVAVTISNRGTVGHVIVDAVELAAISAEGTASTAAASTSNRVPPKLQAQQEEDESSVKSIKASLAEHKKDAPPPLPQAFAIAESQAVRDCELCVRGEHLNRGPVVPRGVLQVVGANTSAQFTEKESGRREVANWIASADNPLTARVIVNRVWSHLLGEGIVRSVDNFGALGERPTHPQLLDHLAKRFVTPSGESAFGEDGDANGLAWSVKRLVREIVLSRTYQLSCEHDEDSWQADPENRNLWRVSRRRLPAEAIRDGILAISEQLDVEPGGSPVQGLGTLVTINNPDAKAYEKAASAKRSLYLPIIRNELPSELAVFDFADPDLVVGKRPTTNVPAQALLLMNSEFVSDAAARTAKKLLQDESRSTSQLVRDAYTRVLSRSPSNDEIADAVPFVSTDGNVQEKRLAQLIHVLFASTEFRMLN